MKTRRPLRIAATTLAVALCGASLQALAPDRAVAPAPTATPPAAAPAALIRWPVGQRLVYALEGSAATDVALGERGPAISSSVRLSGKVAVRVLPPTSTGARLAVRLFDLSAGRFEVLGQDFLQGRRQTGEVTLELDERGRPVAAGTAPGAREDEPLAAWAIGALQADPRGRLTPAPASEPAPLGEALYHYETCATDAEACVVKRLAGYARLDLDTVAPEHPAPAVSGTTTLRVDAIGVPIALDLDERVTVGPVDAPSHAASERRISLRRLTVVPDSEAAPAHALHSLSAATDAEAHRQQRIAGLTTERMLDDLATHANAASMPEHNRWFWRATGLVRADPEAAAALGGLFETLPPGSPGRALLLDVLAGAGSPEAQAVLCTVLGTDAAANDSARNAYHQRLALVRVPTTETLEFAAERVRSASVGFEAGQLTLGAVAGGVCRAQGDAACAPALRLLTATLADDVPTERRAVALRALGNAGVPAVEALAAPFTTSPDPRLRTAAAAALRKLETPSARGRLVDLLGDGDGRVSTRAATALAEQSALDTGSLAALAELCDGGIESEATANLVVSVLQRHLATSPEARAGLESLSRRPRTSRALLARIAGLLRAGGTGG